MTTQVVYGLVVVQWWHTKKIQLRQVRGLRSKLFASPPTQIGPVRSSTKLGRAWGGPVLRRNGPKGDKTRGYRATPRAILDYSGAVRCRFWVGVERPAAELRRGALVVWRSGQNGRDQDCIVRRWGFAEGEKREKVMGGERKSWKFLLYFVFSSDQIFSNINLLISYEIKTRSLRFKSRFQC